MTIKEAVFIKSSSKLKECPEPTLPEYAFIGRSNVGKSSLINMLTGKKSLAKTSSTPGKTQLINHFSINKGQWYLVDLPGYGYAKVAKTEKAKFGKMIESYILKRKSLLSVFVLIDSRHPMQAIDRDFMIWLGEHGIPFVIVFTKIDKLAKNKVQKQINSYKKSLLQDWEELPDSFITSSTQNIGKDDLLDYIEKTNKVFN